jgi:hypothetical protein
MGFMWIFYHDAPRVRVVAGEGPERAAGSGSRR